MSTPHHGSAPRIEPNVCPALSEPVDFAGFAVCACTPTRRRGREVEGTPLLREHAVKNCIKGSNPFVSAEVRVGRFWAHGFEPCRNPFPVDELRARPVRYAFASRSSGERLRRDAYSVR